jgi:ferredoxin
MGSEEGDNSGRVERHLSAEEIERYIDGELDAEMEQRLVFVRTLYRGDDVQTAAKMVGKSEETGRQWLRQWNEGGIGALQPGGTTANGLTAGQQATVEYLDYEILDDYGWDLDDPDLFEKAGKADLSKQGHGSLSVEAGEHILEAAESQGLEWPYSCRGGACANCAAILLDGEIDIDLGTQEILPEEAIHERDIRLTCIGTPATEEIKIVYNAKHEEYLQDIVLPPR